MLTDPWFSNAVIYCLDVDIFKDGNGDGKGDFEGLTQQLDYLAGLGATCVWLMPFYPTPDRDNGYDITDYYGVAPELGDLGLFIEFIRKASDRGIRVIIDLVLNHTSDKHPWFQKSRSDPNSKYRDYYVWREDDPGDTKHLVIFPGQQDSIWTFDKKAGAYYQHRFYHHQPDLNTSNPDVRAELKRIIDFWLQLGISGFRVDAVPFLIESGDPAIDAESCFEFLDDIREFISWRKGDAVMLAEVDVAPTELETFFGDGRRLHLIANFMLNRYLYLALADESAEPLERIVRILPKTPRCAKWANFVRNHDELSISFLTESEKQRIFEKFDPEEKARIYDRGLRRRFPPIVNGDRRILELAYSFIFSAPGTPVLWYGEEIGMGDDLSLPERTSVRTAMQWTGEANAGFSTANPKELFRTPVSEGNFSYKKVNVRDQQTDTESFLNWMERLIRVRKELPEIGEGGWLPLTTDQPGKVFAHRCKSSSHSTIAVFNFTAKPLRVTIDLTGVAGDFLQNMLRQGDHLPLAKEKCTVELEAFGYRWLRVEEKVEPAKSRKGRK
jgi:maltose alpha-D-glucosyltransferase / alpha-amylase